MMLTVGMDRSSIALKIALQRAAHRCSSMVGIRNKVVNSAMSAPTMKLSLALLQISPGRSLAATTASASSSSCRVRRLNLLTDDFCRSKHRCPMPDSRRTRLSDLPSYIYLSLRLPEARHYSKKSPCLSAFGQCRRIAPHHLQGSNAKVET